MGPKEGQIVGTGFPSRCQMCHWTLIVVLCVRGPLARLAVSSPRPLSPFVVPVPRSCPGCRGAALRGEACRSGPCLGRCALRGQGLVYACTAWRLWIGSWFGRCSPCAVTGSGPVPGRRCRPALCDSSLCFGYTPCGPGSGYAGVLRYLRLGLWRCSWYVVMGFGLVPLPVGVVSLPPVSSPPPGARLCRQCRGHSSCGRGSLAPGVRCVQRGWDVGVLVRASGFWAAETVGAGWALCPPLGCCRRRARRCGFPLGVVVLVLLLHRVLCLYCVCGLSCAPRMWAWRHRLYVHLILYRCVLPHVCVHHTGLVGGIPLALGAGVPWILFARCIARHKWRSLSSVRSSHVEELRHIGGKVRSCWVAAFCLWFVAVRRVVVLSCCAALVGVWLCGVAWLWRCFGSQRVLCCFVVWR